MTDLFYVLGGALVAVALAISLFGLRSHGFPATRGLHAGVLAVMGLLVVASCGLAIALSREEAEHREEEVAEFEAEQAAAEEEQPAEEPGTEPAAGEPQVEKEPAPAETIALASPDGTDLVFDQDSLEAPAGDVTIEYTNPQPIPHNVAMEADGNVVAQSDTIQGGDTTEATASLEPGEYVFFCAIPGHREAGMEGTLTVK